MHDGDEKSETKPDRLDELAVRLCIGVGLLVAMLAILSIGLVVVALTNP